MAGTRNSRRRASRSTVFLYGVVLGLGFMLPDGPARAEKPVAGTWVLVDTTTQTLSVFRGQRLVDHFDNVSIGRNGPAKDRVRGDGTTPLGTFQIDRIHRSSRFLLFFRIDYPRPEHARRALDAGRISVADYHRIVAAFHQNLPPPQDTPLGGQLGIHGLGSADPAVHDALNWTQGCIALTNAQVTQLAQWMHLGMRIEVR